MPAISKPVPARTGAFVAPRVAPRNFPAVTEQMSPALKIALGAFWIATWLNIIAVKLQVGPLPIRSLFLLLSLAALLVDRPLILLEAAGKGRTAITVIAAVAALGVAVSLIAATPPLYIIEQVAEIHVQSSLNFLIAAGLMMRCGVTPVLYAYLSVFLFNSLVAIAQFLHVGIAWDLRAAMGRLMHDPPLTQSWYTTHERALGMSYSPVHYATQACLALVAICYARWSDGSRAWKRPDVFILAVAGVAAVGCIATGNRSPLLGIILFLAIYLIMTAPKMMLVLAPLLFAAGLVAPKAADFFADSDIRVARDSDGSSENRGTLRAFGYYLIWQQPWGYGLTFDSTKYWQSYMHQSRYHPNPLSIRRWALHNYYLGLIARYGVTILFLPLLLFPRDRRGALLWMPFAAYAIHIFYHNDGPFVSDFLIFCILPAALFVTLPSTKPSKPKWRSAFDMSDDAGTAG